MTNADNPLRHGGIGPDERWAEQVRLTARALPYPPTPDIAATVRSRLSTGSVTTPARQRRMRLAWAVAILLVLVAGALAVPQVRAAIIELFQIGGVRIFLTPPTPTPTSTPAPTSTGTPYPPTATPLPTPTLLPSLLNLAGETTLEDAQAKAGLPILLPTYPEDLGAPDHVFYQSFNGPFVILVWTDPGHPDRARLSLHEMMCESCVEKNEPKTLATTTVNGKPAAWTEGPYLVQLVGGGMDFRWLVTGHVLIWADGPVTYRLEADASLDEAVKIAESLK